MAIHIMLCCNDYHNGAFLGYAESIEVGDITMVDGRVTVGYEEKKLKDSGPAEGDATLRIGRLRVPCLGYQTWVGNWCWDCAFVRAVHVQRILNYLIKRGFHCEQGPCALFDKINARQDITHADLGKAEAQA